MNYSTLVGFVCLSILSSNCGQTIPFDSNLDKGSVAVSSNTPAAPSRDWSPQNTPVTLAPIFSTFGQSSILQGVEKKISQIMWISKSNGEVTFSLSDATAYTYNEKNENLLFLPAPVEHVPETKTYLMGSSTGWRISADKVECFAPDPTSTRSDPKISVLTLAIKTSDYLPVHIRPEKMTLKGRAEFLFLTCSDAKMTTEKLDLVRMPALMEILPAVVLASFTPDRKFLWTATLQKVLFFGNKDTGFDFIPSIIPLALTPFSGTSLLAMEFDNDKRPVGRIVHARDKQILLSGLASAGTQLTWETDIRPLSEQFCLSCHGMNGSGGWSNADQSTSWTGLKRDSIIARVHTQKSMPPPATEFAKNITDAQRTKILQWLAGGVSQADTGATDVASVPPAKSAPFATPPTPGPTWSSSIVPILVASCNGCHGGIFSTFDTTYKMKSEIITRVENGSMPPDNTKISADDRSKLLIYLKGLP